MKGNMVATVDKTMARPMADEAMSEIGKQQVNYIDDKYSKL